MTRDEIRAKLTDILRDVFDEDTLVAVDSLASDDVAEWDSTNHVRLMVAIETEFGIRFETDEITAPGNVGELLDMIEAKRAS